MIRSGVKIDEPLTADRGRPQGSGRRGGRPAGRQARPRPDRPTAKANAPRSGDFPCREPGLQGRRRRASLARSRVLKVQRSTARMGNATCCRCNRYPVQIAGYLIMQPVAGVTATLSDYRISLHVTLQKGSVRPMFCASQGARLPRTC